MFKSSLLRQFFLSISFMILLPLIAFSIYSANQEKENRLLVKADELQRIAGIIERRIDRSFDKVLKAANAFHLPIEQQMVILNQHFQPLIDDIAKVYPTYDLGIASHDLLRRVALSPGLSSDAIQLPVPEYRELKVYQNGEQEVVRIPSGHWGITGSIAANYPIFWGGRLIGHTWANTQVEDIKALYIRSLRDWLVFTILIWSGLMLLVACFFNRFNAILERLIDQIAREDDNRSSLQQYPQLLPVLDTVIRLRKSYLGEVKKLKRFINACPIAAAVIDKDGIIRAANEQYVQHAKLYFHYDECLIGKPMQEVIAKANVPEEDLVFRRLLRGDQNVEQHQKSGNSEWIARGAIITDEDTGKFRGAIITLTDITELSSYRREIARLDQLNVLGEMAASVAHEIRNPMTVVRGNLQLMAKKAEADSRYQLLINELDRANEIIEEFLSLARNRPVPKSLANLNRILSGLLPLLYGDAVENGSIVELNLGQDIPYLLLNEKEIKQLVVNLCRNAIDAMPDSGRLLIHTRATPEFVDLLVKDDGCGIPADALHKVMEPFYTTKSEGTGLGLAICRSIAEQHNAQMIIESVEGEGTTVLVRFPLQQQADMAGRSSDLV